MSDPNHRSAHNRSEAYRWLLLVLALLPVLATAPVARASSVDAAAAASADDGPGKPPTLIDPWDVTFSLEAIRVEGLRLAREELLLAEARLEAGRSYGEQELGRAIDRIRRLPFVREASFALRKGSRRGLYELVVTIQETRRFFFGVDLISSEGDDGFVFDVGRLEDDADSGLLAGVRFFAGRTGTFFVAAEELGVAAGYERRRLWGRPGSLRLGFEQAHAEYPSSQTYGASVDPGFGPWTLSSVRAFSAAVDFPLGPADAWGLEVEHREAESGYRRLGPQLRSTLLLEDFSDDRLTASWLRDTTDDAIFAERGVRQVVTLTYRQVAADLVEPFAGDQFLPLDYDSQSIRLGFLRSRWWSLIDRHTVWGSVDVAAATTQIDELAVARQDGGFPSLRHVRGVSFESAELAASAGHRFRLFGVGRNPQTGIPEGAFREVYWETSFRASRDEAFGDLVGGVLLQFEARTGIVWRTSWGVFRIGLRFVDSEQDS